MGCAGLPFGRLGLVRCWRRAGFGAAVGEHDGQRDVVQAGAVQGTVAGSGEAGVLAEGGVAHAVVAVPRGPVASWFFGRRAKAKITAIEEVANAKAKMSELSVSFDELSQEFARFLDSRREHR